MTRASRDFSAWIVRNTIHEFSPEAATLSIVGYLYEHPDLTCAEIDVAIKGTCGLAKVILQMIPTEFARLVKNTQREAEEMAADAKHLKEWLATYMDAYSGDWLVGGKLVNKDRYST